MSRKLCHSVSYFTEVDPIPLHDYCKANLTRLAHSEREYILSLNAQVTNCKVACPRQDITLLCSVSVPACQENFLMCLKVISQISLCWLAWFMHSSFQAFSGNSSKAAVMSLPEIGLRIPRGPQPEGVSKGSLCGQENPQ